MAALVRLMVVGFIILTVIYVCLSLYSRSVYVIPVILVSVVIYLTNFA